MTNTEKCNKYIKTIKKRGFKIDIRANFSTYSGWQASVASNYLCILNIFIQYYFETNFISVNITFHLSIAYNVTLFKGYWSGIIGIWAVKLSTPKESTKKKCKRLTLKKFITNIGLISIHTWFGWMYVHWIFWVKRLRLLMEQILGIRIH